MIRPSSGALTLLASACLSLLVSGCSDENPNEPAANLPPAPTKGGPGGPGGPSGPPSNPKLKEIMSKIGKGPQALQGSLGEALKQGEPAWDTIQPKAHEYATLVADMSKHEPVKGTKDSWAKLTASFTEASGELEKAAQAKNKSETVAALDNLGSSCMGCHREHRVMGPPGGGRPGGMGGPPGGFRPPGGPPGPGGPGPGAPPAAPTKPAGEAKPK